VFGHLDTLEITYPILTQDVVEPEYLGDRIFLSSGVHTDPGFVQAAPVIRLITTISTMAFLAISELAAPLPLIAVGLVILVIALVVGVLSYKNRGTKLTCLKEGGIQN